MTNLDEILQFLYEIFMEIPDFLFSLLYESHYEFLGYFNDFLIFCSDSFTDYGSSIFNFFSSKLLLDDSQFIYFIIGGIFSIFIFKLLWNLILSIISNLR